MVGGRQPGRSTSAGYEKSAVASWTSRGTSTSTGPQRPERATWKAALSVAPTSRASCTSHECLTIGIVIPVMSHSWNASVPISVERTWPVMQTSGVESIHASAIGVTRFVAPGPEVAIATPTRPDARA